MTHLTLNRPHRACLEVSKDSNQDGGQGKKTEDLKGMDKGQDKKKNSSDPKEKAPDTATSKFLISVFQL